MRQEDKIYDGVKEILRKYGRKEKKSTNEKVIYECGALIYSIRQEYKEDTRSYMIAPSIYELEKEIIFKLQNQIKYDEEHAEEALQTSKNALIYIELVVRPRTNLSSLAC